jgi:hypothetical protein
MTTPPGDHLPRAEHYEVEREVVDAEVDLSKALGDLARVESRMNMGGDSDHHLHQSAELAERAKAHADQLRAELEQQEKRDKDARPPRGR